MSDSKEEWRVEVFFDGDCPLCVREIKFLKWLDRDKQIRFTDIALQSFDASTFGKTKEEFMDEIQGLLPVGDWIMGVEVFRQLYTAVGFGAFVAPTRLPLISHLLEFGYRLFAKNRLRLTGRCSAETCEVA